MSFLQTPPPKYPALSYELFPPRSTSGEAALWRTIRELEDTRPDFVSVTYGASGSNRDTALALLKRLLTETPLKPLAHLTCVGNSTAHLMDLIDELISLGVRGILALRGDRPQDHSVPDGDLHYASELVELIRDVERLRTAHLCAGKVAVGVAAYATKHPESPSLEHDIEVLLAKQAAGADFAITQVYFDPEHYRRLLRTAHRAGVQIPIIPGVIPFTSVRRLQRLGEVARIDVDPALLELLMNADDGAERRRIGVQATVDLAHAALDDGAPGLHLYTFNEHAAALDVLDRLELSRPPALDLTPSA